MQVITRLISHNRWWSVTHTKHTHTITKNMSSPPSPAAAAESYDSVMRALDVGTPCRLVKTAAAAAATGSDGSAPSPAAPQGVAAAAVRARDTVLEARVIDAGLLAERTRVRDGWGAVDAAAFEVARSVADPLLRVKHTLIPFRTRAALKLADIDQEAALVSVLPAAAVGDGDDDTFYFEDLCGAPGSWTEYVLWALNVRGFLPASAGIGGTAAKGWGYSLSTDNPLLDWQLEYFNKTARAGASRLRREAFCFRGETGDGDITSNRNIQEFALLLQEETCGAGVHLSMGDGGLIKEEAFENTETQLRRILLCEVLCMLLTLRRGGNFIVKVLDIQSTFSVHLMWVLYNEFEEVDLVKPTLSRPANSERYFIGKGRRNAAPFAAFGAAADASVETLLAYVDGLVPAAGQSQLSAEQVCQLLYAVNALEGAASPSPVQGFVKEGTLSDAFVAWLASRNNEQIATQTSVCAILRDATTRPDAYAEVAASVHADLVEKWWGRSRLLPYKKEDSQAKRRRHA